MWTLQSVRPFPEEGTDVCLPATPRARHSACSASYIEAHAITTRRAATDIGIRDARRRSYPGLKSESSRIGSRPVRERWRRREYSYGRGFVVLPDCCQARSGPAADTCVLVHPARCGLVPDGLVLFIPWPWLHNSLYRTVELLSLLT